MDSFPVPPVCTANWSVKDWEEYIARHLEDKDECED